MQLRAEAAEETRQRVLEAAYRLWLEHHYDEVSLEQVATSARVSKQTVIRQFGSKDQLAYAVVDWQRPREEAARVVEPGDVRDAAKIVVDRYEKMGGANVRMLEIEHRIPAIDYLLAQGRESHRRWIERVFEPFLPKRRGAAHKRRVMAFYAATDVMTWKLLRHDFQLSCEETKAVVLQLLMGLVGESKKEDA
jgi:AcrR family transcriptional regulator